MPFDRQRYLLHLVPVGNRYLLARQRGIFPSKPAVLRKPEWDMVQPHSFGALNGRGASSLGLLDWLEHIHSSQIRNLFLSRQANAPFVALNALSNWIDEPIPRQISWVYPEGPESLLVPQLAPPIEKPTQKRDDEIAQKKKIDDELKSLMGRLRTTLEQCIEFSKRHRFHLAGWEESLSLVKNILFSNKAPFSEYLYFTDPSIRQKDWRLLRHDESGDLDLAQTVFQSAELLPLLIEKRSVSFPALNDKEYYERLLQELEDLYLDCLIMAANRL
jgi:hypothetical protein